MVENFRSNSSPKWGINLTARSVGAVELAFPGLFARAFFPGANRDKLRKVENLVGRRGGG